MDYTTYAAFGQRFFEHAVSEERILGALGGLAGDEIDFGPIGVGPARLAKVSAHGEIGQSSIERLEGDEVAFLLTIPVDLLLHLDLGVDQHRFKAAVRVNLHLTARAADPLRVVIDIEPPTKQNVHVKVEGDSLRASLLQLVAGIDGEIRKFVAKFVAKEIDKPHIRAARDIDVGARIDAAWAARGV